MTGPGRAEGAPRRLDAASLPAGLRELSRPVAGLWCLGDAESLAGAPARHVALVGTREASPYGIRTAERLAALCARAGVVVVSGMARGIDAAAHRAALAAGGRTIAVQGTGVDVPYPASHRALHTLLCDRGTVVSEMEPGTKATPGCFPRRNRIIAGLSQVVVVVEAPFKSGAINTAAQALELGRVVAAVPGRIDEAWSAGSNQLIRDGAQVIAEPADLLAILGISTSVASITKPTDGEGLPADPFDGAASTSIERSRASGDGAEAGGEAGEPGDSTRSWDADELPFRLIAVNCLDGELEGRLARDGLGYRER